MKDRVEDSERTDAEPRKRPYAPPKLHRYGDIRELTRGDGQELAADTVGTSV